MSAEFVDTNVLIYAHDGGAGAKHQHALELLERLFEDRSGALSIQVLCEFYAAATKKLSTVSEEAEAVIADLGGRTIRRPAHSDLLKAARLQRRYRIGWVARPYYSERRRSGMLNLVERRILRDGQRYDRVTVRDPFR